MPLTPIPSAGAKQTIKVAFESLNKTILPSNSRSFAETTLQDVRTSALQLEEKLAARRALRNMRRLDPLFKGLEHYSKVAEILCNGTPYLSWIWAPITLILKIASDYVEAFEKIINAYSMIADSLKIFEFLNKAFASNNDFQQTLAVFYADILEFHQYAYKFITRNGWKLLFLTSWGRFQRRFNSKLENMKRHERLIGKEANARNIAEAQEMRQEIRQWRQENLEQIERLEREEAEKQYHSIASWLKVDDSEQQEIFNALHSEGQNYPGTCDWALRNKHVQLFFKKKPITQTLWLHGVPGAGKSVLSAELANFAEAAGLNVIRFFCSRSYRSNTYQRILGSLFLQLVRKDGELIANVYRESVLGKPPPSSAALEKLFREILRSFSGSTSRDEYIYVFIDGMFLYARLILDYLANNIFIRGAQIISAVNSLPDKLSDLLTLLFSYRQLLSQILAHLNTQSVEHVKTMFRWIAFARRPLTRVEFLSAMAFSDGNYAITKSAPKFILEASSSLSITEEQAVEEQGIATVACLLSGLRTFTKPHDDKLRNVQVVRGLHVLHIYATEYWTDYLFRHLELPGSGLSMSQLIDLTNNLSQWLDSLAIHTLKEPAEAKPSILSPRLELLKDYPAIQKQARIAICARSLKELETRVSTQELEEFKRHFRTSAYTCRFGSCPRATIGFGSKEARLEH
ncbi:hypothetical protein EV127DRAFT_457871 [Xylaria flabelliformis]|nr:hypothetical protein EV127DRAFT_457871 [Xylaria flabelliformis]